MKVVV